MLTHAAAKCSSVLTLRMPCEQSSHDQCEANDNLLYLLYIRWAARLFGKDRWRKGWIVVFEACGVVRINLRSVEKDSGWQSCFTQHHQVCAHNVAAYS